MTATPPERRIVPPLLLLVFAAVVLVAIFALKDLGSGPAPIADATIPDATTPDAATPDAGVDAHAPLPDAGADDVHSPAAAVAPPPRAPAPRPAEPAPTAPAPAASHRSPRPIPRGAALPAVRRAASPTALDDALAAAATDGTEPNEDAERLVYAPDREGIQTAVGGEMEHLRECYEAWLKADPDIGGEVTVQLVISAPDPALDPDPDSDDEALARISGVKIMGTSLTGESAQFIEGCVMNVMSSLLFDPPAGGPLTIYYPFIFRSETD